METLGQMPRLHLYVCDPRDVVFGFLEEAAATLSFFCMWGAERRGGMNERGLRTNNSTHMYRASLAKTSLLHAVKVTNNLLRDCIKLLSERESR